jgi:putative heme iron utilization protein
VATVVFEVGPIKQRRNVNNKRPSHADGAVPQPSVPEPTHAERARTLLEIGGFSTLSTMSAKHAGFPFGSVMPYGLTDQGEPIFLISSMAMHTRNLLENPKATLLVVDHSAAKNPLGASRLSIMGSVKKVSDQDRNVVKAPYLRRNSDAKQWVEYADFHFFRMTVVDVYFVGGFGVMGWVEAPAFQAAAPDPLLEFASGIIEHMNDDHAAALVAIGSQQVEWEVESATMTSVDRLGFHVRMVTTAGPKGARIAFPNECVTSDQVRAAMIELVTNARAKE